MRYYAWDTILEILYLRYSVHQFSDKKENFEVLVLKLPKNRFWVKISKSKSGFRISSLEILCEPLSRLNRLLWNFVSKLAHKRILGSKFQKFMSGFEISILEMLCAPIFRQNGQLWNFRPRLVQKLILGSEFQKRSPDSESALPRYHVCQFSVKMDNSDFFGPNFPKKEIRIWKSEL